MVKFSGSRLARVIRKPGFWLIIALLVLIALPHYSEYLQHPAFLTQIMASFKLERHAFERILFLVPIVWAGFLFGWKGAAITSVAALALMLPRALLLSPFTNDALFESSAVFIIGNVLAISFDALRKAREQRTQLEEAHRELQRLYQRQQEVAEELRISEQRYRELFENAHDAIWLHNLEGNIITANRAAEILTGYIIEELTRLNVKSFLSAESHNLANQIREKLLDNEPVVQPYEQRIIRKDGSEAFIQITTSVVFSGNKPVAFQHIARDVSEERRLQENLRFYLQQATRAQEEERKRISRELHDETLQALVVLARNLDALASRSNGLSEDNRPRLEELREQTNNIMLGVRRLSQDLRPAALDRLGLLSALEWLAADVTQYSGIATKVSVVGTERRFPEEVELVLFRITQEALRNVWRHSQATQAEVTVEFNERKTSITVHDNGKGFDLPKTIGDLAREGKLGLAGMQERARLIGGTLIAQSEPGKGSTITVEIPA